MYDSPDTGEAHKYAGESHKYAGEPHKYAGEPHKYAGELYKYAGVAGQGTAGAPGSGAVVPMADYFTAFKCRMRPVAFQSWT